MTKGNKIFVGVLIVIALGIGWIALGRDGNRSASEAGSVVGLREGNLAPAFEVTTVDGATVKSDDLRGRVIVMTSGAAWCGTCTIEAQQFAPVFAKYRDDDITFLTVDIDPSDSQDFIKEVRQDNNTPWDYTDASGGQQVIQDYKLNRFEITYVIDKAGIVRFKDGEITSTAVLDQVIQRLL